MIVYLDTSIVLRVLFNQTPRLAGWGTWRAAYCSELAGIEARRAIDRMRLSQLLDDEEVARAHQELARLEGAFGILALNRSVLRRAAMPMPTAVKTLDAFHLASALVYREQRDDRLAFATHDEQQARAALALGFEVFGRAAA